MQESFSLELRKWENLDILILAKIFSGVPLSDLFINVSSVCNSWLVACWDALFWGQNTLDLSAAMAALGNVGSRRSIMLRKLSFYRLVSPERFKHIDVKLMKLLKSIMEGNDAYGFSLEHWRLSVRNIVIPTNLYISDQHLLYIAERTPNLESLNLFGSSRISTIGFTKALCEWKNIKYIGFGPINRQYLLQILEVMGKNCPKLETLHLKNLYLKLDEDITHKIIRTLPQVKTLKIEDADLFNEGVKPFLEENLKLQAVYFCDCFFMEDYFTNRYCINFTIRYGERHGQWCFVAVDEEIVAVDEEIATMRTDLQSKFDLWMQKILPFRAIPYHVFSW